MRILLISNVFPPGFIGGYELGALDVATHLHGRGHEVHVLTSDYFRDERAELDIFPVDRGLTCNALSHDVPVAGRAFDLKRFIDWSNVRRVEASLSKIKPDLIIAFNLAGLGALGLQSYLRDCGAPVLFYFMDNFFGEADPGSREYAEFRRVFGPPSVGPRGRVVSMSRNVMKEVDRYLDYSGSDLVFIPGWIDETKVAAEVREFGDTPARFVYCSRVAPHKGADVMLDAAALLWASGQRDFTIAVYGSGQVTPFLQRASMLGLDGAVTYKGALSKDEMLQAFGEYDALLFPTWEREPYGFVVSEAAAAGCIPIFTNGIGASEWFIDGDDCLKIARTPESLAGAMRDIMSLSCNERVKRRRRSMASAKRNLGVSRWMDFFEKECRSLVEDRPARSPAYRSVAASYLALQELWKESL